MSAGEEPTQGGGDSLSLSFLDTISCGLGAAVLLALIFSVVRDRAQTQTSSPPFIFADFLVTPDVQGIQPLINIVVTDPIGLTHDLRLEDFNPLTGRLNGETGPVPEGGNVPVYLLNGFSRSGQIGATDTTGRRHFMLTILNPTPGPWALNVRYHNVLNARDIPPTQDFPTVKVEARVVVREKRPVELTAPHLPFGDVTHFDNPILIQTPHKR